jgi:hypothetical protein
MNQRKTSIIPFIASIGIFLQHINLPSPAYAGGFDNPSSTSQAESVDNPSSSKSSPVFNWKKWSKPFYKNQSVCREYIGNVICLTPQAAKKVNWQIR